LVLLRLLWFRRLFWLWGVVVCLRVIIWTKTFFPWCSISTRTLRIMFMKTSLKSFLLFFFINKNGDIIVVIIIASMVSLFNRCWWKQIIYRLLCRFIIFLCWQDELLLTLRLSGSIWLARGIKNSSDNLLTFQCKHP